MSQNVVVVTGVNTSPLGALPFQTSEGRTDTERKIFSGKEYGNYLAEVWDFMKTQVLSPSLEALHPLTEAIRGRGWSVITDTVDGLLAEANIWPLVETSGSLFRGKCLRCQTVLDLTKEDYKELAPGETFACTKCGKHRVRPDVVLLGEKMRNRRLVDDFISEADIVVFVGVDESDADVRRWASLARKSVIVSETEGPLSAHRIIMTPEEWAAKDCPLM